MTTRQISFAIRGMFCAKCAMTIERALARLDGVASASVNYAAERATVVYDPARMTARAIVDAVRREGFDVPFERVRVSVDGLLYATSHHTIEKALRRTAGVLDLTVNLDAKQISVDVLSDHLPHLDLERALAQLGFHIPETNTSSQVHGFVLRATLACTFALLSLWSAGEHAGLLAETGLFHFPFLVLAISFLALFGAGFPFYRLAYDAFLQGEFDASILVALISSVFFLVGAPLTLIAPTPWLARIAPVIATTLTAAWFIVRGFTALLLPRIAVRRHILGESLAAQARLGVISHGTRD